MLTSVAVDTERPFGSALRGTVDDYLIHNTTYDYGDSVEFEGRHVYAC